MVFDGTIKLLSVILDDKFTRGDHRIIRHKTRRSLLLLLSENVVWVQQEKVAYVQKITDEEVKVSQRIITS